MSNMLRGKLCFKGDKGDKGQDGQDAYPIEILTGIINVAGEDSGSDTVSYPTGFNKENTLVISAITKVTLVTGSSEMTYWANGSDTIRVSMVGLNDDSISISVSNTSTNAKDIAYKVAIMKVD